MDTYYHRGREGQESCAVFTAKIHMDAGRENASFATFPAPENLASSPATQGLPYAQGHGGLVYGSSQTSHTYAHQFPFITTWLARQPTGTQRYITHKAKIAQAANKKTKGWLRLSSDDRERRVLDFAFRSESIAWTLNLTPQQEARLRGLERPAKALADAINRASKRLLGRAPPISLALEVTPTGRLHAHGIVTLERGEWKAFREALKSAGGKFQGRGAGRQTDTRKLWNATGWASYIAKDFDRTAEALGTEKIFYQCNATRAGAREEYEASLARQKALRRRQSVNVDLL
ncbi:hypothetical protein HJA89_16325 [Rhizobium bangladeshense]|uniref:hypothetical protein n=1 Tax=Rhizobium bangladeshense TaxID=1138189 RepID=UPI001C829772|nr:hypothetical protein [Rhizobium bangladeshense]MBX4874441.1 hypothetical protein [Rhizobium bangladeshense]